MNKADLGIIFLTLLMGLVLLAFVTYEAYGQELTSTANIICQLTNLYPYYDCPEYIDGYFDASGEAWIIVTVPVERFMDPLNVSVFGYAVYSDIKGEAVTGDLSVCKFFPDLNQTVKGVNLCELYYIVVAEYAPDTCYSPYPCMSILEHELKHLQCKCDWHKGLTSKAHVIVI